VLPGYLTEGLSVLAGRPKIGKSWLALGLADAIARGGAALGNIDVKAGSVLYLGLEDTQRRLQQRLRAVRQGLPASPKLDLATTWPRLDQGGHDQLKLWLSRHPDARLVIIDTFQKIRGKPPRRDAGVYETDSEAVAGIKALADEYGVAILAVLHLRKSAADDPLDEISGSTGLTGAVDSILILKRDRANADAVLFATGRDIEEIESALQFDPAKGAWTLLGGADEFRQSKERNAIIRLLLVADAPMSPKEIADALGKNISTLKTTLARMLAADLIKRADRGKYTAE
jgi:RecA-family ATPase